MNGRNRRKRGRGIKAIFCFLLAAGLLLGQFGTSALAEGTGITDFAEKSMDTPANDTEEEAPDSGTDGKDHGEKPDTSNNGSGEENSDVSENDGDEENPGASEDDGDDDEENPGVSEDGGDDEENPGTSEDGGDDEENPGASEDGGDDEENPDASDNGGDEENPDASETLYGAGELPAECICEALCAEDRVNEACPVCAEDFLLCCGEEETEAEEEIALQSETRAAGSFEIFDDNLGGLVKYTIKGSGSDEVELTICIVGGSREMSDTVTYEGQTYSVVAIGEGAFAECTGLKALTVPDSVKTIGAEAFYGCTSLQEIKLPSGITEIKKGTFSACRSLQTVELPDSVTELGENAFSGCNSLETVRMDHVIRIGKAAFSGCGMETVKIPDGVMDLSDSVFRGCTKLTTVEIPDSVTRIGYTAFEGCTSLNTLKISVKLWLGNVSPIHAESTAFQKASKGEIIFMTADGTAPYPNEGIEGGPTLLEVCDTYDLNEWNSLKDATWYGWKLPVYSVTKVNIPVLLDGKPWENHQKSFVLRNDRGWSYVTGDIIAADGNYWIYEDTGTGEQGYLDTGKRVKVTVMDGSEMTSDPVEYFTATFYDGEDAYGDDTPQASQIVLGGKQKVIKPSEDPAKEGYTFDKWVTEKNGDSEFKFGTISKTTKIYASWMTGVYKVTINVELDDAEWKGHGKSYALRMVGGTTYLEDFSRVKNGTYNLFEVTGTAGNKKYLDLEKHVVVNDESQTVTMQYYTFYALAGLHGTIDPTGATVLRGVGSPTFHITADTGYCIESLLVNEQPVKEAAGKAAYEYRVPNVSETYVIKVAFTEELPADGHEVRIRIRKNDLEWEDNGKKFYAHRPNSARYTQFKKGENGEHTVLLDNGTYRIYESLRPNLDFDPNDSAYQQYMNDTGLDIKVQDSDEEVYLDYYTVYLRAGENVTLPQGPVNVLKGSSAFFEIQPDADFVISSVLLDGEEVDKERLAKTRKEGGFTLLPQETVEVHSIEVNCKRQNVDIWIQKNNQLWTESGKSFWFHNDSEGEFSDKYTCGEDGKIHVYLDDGTYTIYELVGTETGGTPQSTRVTFEAGENYQIVAVDYFTVVSSAGKGGTIEPNDEKIVLKGTDCAFRLKSDEGFRLKALRVNGKDESGNVDQDGNYSLKNIQSPKRVEAVFEEEGASYDEYEVRITVNKDDVPWGAGNERVYTFKEADKEDYTESYAVDENGSFTAKLRSGTYEIYEVRDTVSRAWEYYDTGVSVEVGQNVDAAEAAVDYYTVTFYDGAAAYGEETDQRPQIILKNEGVSQPSAPSKSGYSFDGWKTTEDGDTAFDFADAKVTAPTGIYASWISGARPEYRITASSGAGGSISPNGIVLVTEGISQTFRITADAGYKIKSVFVDGVDQGAVDNYSFTNVTGDHKIEAVFEKAGTGGSGTDPDNPGGGGTGGSGTDPDNPGGGGTGGSGTDPDNPGGGGTGGSGTDPDNPGGGGTGGSGTDPDNPGGGGTGGSGTDPDNPGGGGTGGSGTDPDNPGGGGTSGGETGSGNSGGSVTGSIAVNVDGEITSMFGTTAGNTNAGLNGGNAINGDNHINERLTGGKGTEGSSAVSDEVSMSGTTSASETDTSRAGEPKTSDAFHYEVYATIAMIAGIVYLILFLLDGRVGMTAEEKERIVASLLRWAKQGKTVTWRKYIAIMAVFFVLLYYHALGRYTAVETRTA